MPSEYRVLYNSLAFFFKKTRPYFYFEKSALVRASEKLIYLVGQVRSGYDADLLYPAGKRAAGVAPVEYYQIPGAYIR